MTGTLQVRELPASGWLLCVAAPAAMTSLDPLAAALGVAVPTKSGAVTTTGERSAYWLSPTSWLIQIAPGDEDATLAAVLAAYPDRLVHAARFSDALHWLSLSGAGAEDLLKQGGFISLEPGGLPIGGAKRTLVAGIAAILHRHGASEWSLGIEQSRAAFIREWIAAAEQGLGSQHSG